LIKACLQELKRCQIFNPSLLSESQTDLLNLESALSPWFETKCRRYLDKHNSGDEVPEKVKRLLDDIMRLKHYMNMLETEDGKAFAAVLDALRSMLRT